MNCYLKVSYHSRHKKYRLGKDREINFSQIRRELMINLPSQSVAFLICNPQQSKPSVEKDSKNETIMSQKELGEYFKKLYLKEGQTVKIKIIQRDIIKEKGSRSNENDSSQINIPDILDRQRSKSQDITIQNPGVSTKTSTIEVTQEFLYNSSFEYDQVGSVYLKEWILRDLQINSRRKKQLEERKRLTSIPQLYRKINAAIQFD